MNAIEQLNSFKGQLNYVNNVLAVSALEEEYSNLAEEYLNLEEEYEEEIIRLTKHIKSNTEIFE